MYFSKFSDEEKIDISKQLKDHTIVKAKEDYNKLKIAVLTKLDEIKPLSPIGLKFIETFMHIELLNTKSKQGISFYDFWYNQHFYMVRDASTKRLIESIKSNKPYLSYIKIAKQVFNLYYGSISIFRPTIASKLYHHYKPTTILDFTAGWGGRLIGATLLNVPKYIGIDNNIRLEEHYKKMVEHLKNETTTEIELHFKDALDVDYSKMEYDMVFTSPPYYNKEIYGLEKSKSKEEWDEKFYKPVFKKTWDGLKNGGVYCLNVPNCIYNDICVPLLGEANESFEMKKYARVLPKKEQKQTNVGHLYKEQIYIWVKK